MTRNECIELGYITKAHGLKGELKAQFDVHDMQEYEKRKSFYLAKKDQALTKVRVKRMQVLGQGAVILKIEGVNYRDEAEALKGSTIYFPESDLPTLEEGQFYYFQIIGYEVEDLKYGKLGAVKDIMETSGQDILIMEYKDREVFIPMTDAFLLNADHEEKIVKTAMPDGLLEFYLGNEEN